MLIARRSVLRGMAGAAATPLFLHGLAAEAASAGNMITVVVGLAGGNDGLNTVIPLTQYGYYATLRTPPQSGGTLAYSEAALLATAFNSSPTVAAGKATQFAFAPTMAPMRQLYATGKLAVIAGIGLPSTETASLSHFNAWSDWSTGQLNVSAGNLPPGWLATALAGAKVGVLGATASTGGGQPVITGPNGLGLTVGDPAAFNITIPSNNPSFLLGDAFQQMLDVPTTNATAARDRAATLATVGAVGAMQGFAQLAGDYPQPVSGLGYQLRTVAQMILGSAGIRGYVGVDGPYDTHSDQNGGNVPHSALVGNLGTSLSQFYNYLKQKHVSSNVVIVTISDFGRTPMANLSLGTDHGAASVAFVLGDPVKGGVYGNYPSLKTFDNNGNLAVKVDFRNMLSDIIQAMGGNATTVLGKTWPKLGFI